MSQNSHARATTPTTEQPRPIRRSPLEFGRWYTKAAFEKRYQLNRFHTVVTINGGSVQVRVRPYNLHLLLTQHDRTDAYFQLAWNDQPHTREKKVMVKGKRSAERFVTTTTTDPAYTTVKLRICHALTPERDTEIVLHDGYGLPDIDRWWERAQGSDLALPLPAEVQATPEIEREVAA